MTIRELIENYSNKLPLNINTIDGKHNITVEDIMQEKFCKRFQYNTQNSLLNYGLAYENNEIIVYYSIIKSIIIQIPEKKIAATSEKINLNTFANIITYRNSEIYSQKKEPINSLITINGIQVKLINKTWQVPINKSYNEKEYIIKATYGYYGKLYYAKAILHQEANIISDWILGQKQTLNIETNINENTLIPSTGCMMNIDVYETYANEYAKYDSFGNTIKKKKDIINHEKITDKCSFADGNYYRCLNNTIYINKQPYNSPQRCINITFKYNTKQYSIKALQQAGDSLSEELKLSFKDETSLNTIYLSTWGKSEEKIPIICQKNIIINNNIIKTISIVDKILIQNNCNWIQYNILNNCLTLQIEENSTIYNRIAEIDISLDSKVIKLIICQPKPEISKEDYFLVYNGDDYISSSIANNYAITIKCYKKTEYSNNVTTTKQINNITNVNVQSSNPEIALLPNIQCTKDGNIIGNIVYNEYPNTGVQLNINLTGLTSNNNFITLNKCINILASNSQKIELVVYVINTDSNEKISEDCSSIQIIDVKTQHKIVLQTNCFWLNSIMQQDIIFKGDINLIIGHEYKITINSLIYGNIITKPYSETYLIENDDIGIDMYVKI